MRRGRICAYLLSNSDSTFLLGPTAFHSRPLQESLFHPKMTAFGNKRPVDEVPPWPLALRRLYILVSLASFAPKLFDLFCQAVILYLLLKQMWALGWSDVYIIKELVAAN